jgi:hypothetical protein
MNIDIVVNSDPSPFTNPSPNPSPLILHHNISDLLLTIIILLLKVKGEGLNPYFSNSKRDFFLIKLRNKNRWF